MLYEKVYCARGRKENLIKDIKLYTRSDRTSCHRWEANQFRLLLHMGAYWLLHELRGAAPKRSIWRTATLMPPDKQGERSATIRMRMRRG